MKKVLAFIIVLAMLVLNSCNVAVSNNSNNHTLDKNLIGTWIRKDTGVMGFTILTNCQGVVNGSDKLYSFFTENGVLYIVELNSQRVVFGEYKLKDNTLVFNEVEYEKKSASETTQNTHHSDISPLLTVSINKSDATKYALFLSETRDFYTQTALLNAHISKEMTNISESWLPNDLDNIDGEHNGQNYVAYTFYLKNAGEATVTYNYQMYMVNISNDLNQAIRIRLYIDGKWTNYARTASNGTGAEPGTTEFLTERIITQGAVAEFEPGEVTKYTVVIWIEGDDPDCIDDLVGGDCSIAMDFDIVK